MGRPKKQMYPEAECQGHNLARELRLEDPQHSYSLPFTEDQIGLATTITQPTTHTYSSGQQFAPFVGGIGGVDFLADITFGQRNLAAEKTTASHPPDATEPDPRATIKAGGSPEWRTDTSCRCLSMIFSALDALSRLPDRVEDAIYVARGAPKTVHDVASCTQCGLRLFQHGETPPIRPSQNVTMLMAIFPAIASAYEKVLELAEIEVAQAKQQQRSLVFQLGSYGGAWGQAHWESGGCVESHNNLTLDADSWKRLVRALLRADLHGHGKYQTGLWEIIQEIKSKYTSTPNRDHLSTFHTDAPLPAGSGLGSPTVVRESRPGPSGGEMEEFSKVVEEAQYALSKLVIY